MAFPIPSHLPRKRDNDVSTKLLTKMSEVTTKALTFELASSWVSELDTTIRDTKVSSMCVIQNDHISLTIHHSNEFMIA